MNQRPRGAFRGARSRPVRHSAQPAVRTAGSEIFGWAHKTFEEYLAARYLVEHRLTSADLYGFLAVRAPGGGDGIPAPLREVAAWAAALSPSFFRYLVDAELDVLLQSDVAAALPAEGRGAGQRLARADRPRRTHRDLFRPNAASAAGSPKPHGSDRQVSKDPKRTVLGKRAAIDIAEANDLKTLSGALADLAAAPTAPILLRKDAAYAVYRFENDGARARLAPLLKTDLSDDVDDDLRGAILLSARPDHLSVADLLAALTPPKRASYIGAYASFLYNLELVPFSAEDAVAAIGWLAERLPSLTGDAIDFTTRDAYGRILWAAAARTTQPAVRDAMADLAAEAFTDLSQWLFDDGRGPDWTWPGAPADRVDLVRCILQALRCGGSPGPARFSTISRT